MKNGYVLSESFLHLLLWLIFRQSHPNFINVRTAYASEIWAQLTKNHLTKSSTEKFRESITTQTIPSSSQTTDKYTAPSRTVPKQAQKDSESTLYFASGVLCFLLYRFLRKKPWQELLSTLQKLRRLAGKKQNQTTGVISNIFLV